jgi:four helix bundle protein
VNSEGLKQRTKEFALRVIRMSRTLPRTAEAKVIANQLLRSATSTAANYRACCLARSRAEFISKIGVVLEEADESLFWIELLAEADVVPAKRLTELRAEAAELAAIFAASRLTAGKL